MVQKSIKNSKKLAFVSPEPEYIAEGYVVKIPVTQLQEYSPWQLRLEASKLIENRIGDHVQLTSLKIRRPAIRERLSARLAGRVPNARLHLTITF